MAFAFLSHVVADLTLGKPALFWLPTTASIRDALWTLKELGDDASDISIWECVAGDNTDLGVYADRFPGGYAMSGSPQCCDSHGHCCCCCVGKVCMQKIICYLASDKSLGNLAEAVDAPVTALIPEDNCPDITIQHIDPRASLLEALQLIAEGAQNLVVPIAGHVSKFDQQIKGEVLQKKRDVKQYKSALPLLRRSHNGQAYCWLTHEDVLRFLLGSIRVFSPLPTMSIEDLGIIQTNVSIVGLKNEAVSALEMIKAACLEMSAVAVVDNADDASGAFNLVGDISCNTLQACNETAAIALAMLSVGEFLTYVKDCWNLVNGSMLDLIWERLSEKLGELKGCGHTNVPFSKAQEVSLFLQEIELWDKPSSSDGEESGSDSPTGPHEFSPQCLSMQLRAASKVGYTTKSRSGPICCNPKSSLVAVLLQALAYREHYVWVTGEDGRLLGIVTFRDVLNVMLNHVNI